jgi:hypothetical protein
MAAFWAARSAEAQAPAPDDAASLPNPASAVQPAGPPSAPVTAAPAWSIAGALPDALTQPPAAPPATDALPHDTGLVLGGSPAGPASGPATASSTGATSASGTPALPPALPAQIAEALAARTERPVELRMLTEELGALQVSLQQTGDHLRVFLQADRGDTLDLLRRNADLLLQELRAAGFAGATLSFGDGGAGGRDRPEPPAPDQPAGTARPADPAATPATPAAEPPPARALAGASLDLRF